MMDVVPDGILDSAVGQVIRNVRARRKAQVPLMSFALANTGEIKNVVTSRQGGFSSRMLGDRLNELSRQMASVNLPLQLKPLDVLFAQRSASLVGTLQETARVKGNIIIISSSRVVKCRASSVLTVIIDGAQTCERIVMRYWHCGDGGAWLVCPSTHVLPLCCAEVHR